MEEGKLIGMKSHNCHVFMETLIPIAFSHFLERIWKPITEISLFFRDLCSGKLLESSLDRMEQNIPVITTKLEKIFPCGFSDVMEHILIHLIEEAHLGGPVQMRWMYPGERWHPASKEVNKAVRESVRRLFSQPWHSWSEIPKDHRQAMFEEFKAGIGSSCQAEAINGVQLAATS
ncbi:uncharacterized protein LOC107872501 [Capsicum annuum]|uniref:uncharacterized protein LOC107872501 n=1 Tax=Capsicum annuum TaxID=4072 RepID=UPI001FB14BF4|nr:uncharacterized protein LOC107872501 [Capsicum annuum]